MSYYSDSQKDSLRAVGNRIRELREAKGVTQDDMASFLGTTRTTVAKWENGAQNFKSETIDRMARYFDCSIDFLLRGSSAETYDIYRMTGLVDAAIEKMNKYNNSPEADFADGELVYIDLINELLSDDGYYALLWQFLDFRKEWRSIQAELKEQEKAAKAAEPRSAERRKVNESIRDLNECAEFLRWKYTHRLDAYTKGLLEGE
ncbi:MAG: helix-turn-helix domain-containing protein [Oscillospiraceae bacterium]|jgi:transcriptional regulator with XRE-family HTH domain|nr:helix-turn-helix domain-containing protein [Oscillospiraceae bacterium]